MSESHYLKSLTKPISRYVLMYLEDPLRNDRLNVAVIAWSDTESGLVWRFTDDLTILCALHIQPEYVSAYAQQFEMLPRMWSKEHLFEEFKKPKTPYTWIGFTKPCASFTPPIELAADIYRMILARPARPEVPEGQLDGVVIVDDAIVDDVPQIG